MLRWSPRLGRFCAALPGRPTVSTGALQGRQADGEKRRRKCDEKASGFEREVQFSCLPFAGRLGSRKLGRLPRRPRTRSLRRVRLLVLRRALEAGRRLPSRAGRSLADAEGAVRKPALGPYLGAGGGGAGRKIGCVAPRQDQGTEQADQSPSPPVASARASPPAQGVTSTPRQNATRSLISSAAGLGSA